MAKFKPAGGKKRETPASTRGLIPCAVLVILGLGIIFGLMYFSLQTGK